ncbi:DegV family protein [Paenibacillus sp. HN-1]|uniref:DegV family protein n=1 Tax=Paenibacillus TaxID=44249 RepID=UPI001CA7B7CC|nr:MULTISPECIES: DegV family protein [Paenibacillus]MBY9079090.1 DegV family protein [Paenibacillus sp. CGMCC 1.18879]MBY9086868.1 DegV family protein [Paenibacillus sinensis]
MSKVRIYADSISDIPQGWIDQHNIGVVPLYIAFGNEVFRDKIEIAAPEMFRLADATGMLPQTIAPSPADFLQAFGPAVAAGEDVLYISMSSKLSSTYQNGLLASKEFPPGRVTVVDSLNVSAGTAMLVLLAAEMAAEGKSALSIADTLRKVREDIRFNVVLKHLDYLHKGGRVGNLQHLLGSILQIRPVLYASQGRMCSGAKIRGNVRKVMKQILQSIINHREHISHDRIIIVQSMEEETVEWLRDYILEETGIRNVPIIEGGCAICAHSGPHSVGISYALKLE